MIVVTTNLSNNPNDKREMEPVVETLVKLPDELGEIKNVVADTGYYSEHNVKVCEQHELQPLIAHGSHTTHLWLILLHEMKAVGNSFQMIRYSA